MTTPTAQPSADQTPSYPSAKEVADVIMSELQKETPSASVSEPTAPTEQAMEVLTRAHAEVSQKAFDEAARADKAEAELAARLTELSAVKAELENTHNAFLRERDGMRQVEDIVANVVSNPGLELTVVELVHRAVSQLTALRTAASQAEQRAKELERQTISNAGFISRLEERLDWTEADLAKAQSDITAKDATIARLEGELAWHATQLDASIKNGNELAKTATNALADSASKAKALGEIKKLMEQITEIRWGWDGDCGADRCAHEAIEIIESALPSLPEQEGK